MHFDQKPLPGDENHLATAFIFMKAFSKLFNDFPT
jgi:hypothetical protein